MRPVSSTSLVAGNDGAPPPPPPPPPPSPLVAAQPASGLQPVRPAGAASLLLGSTGNSAGGLQPVRPAGAASLLLGGNGSSGNLEDGNKPEEPSKTGGLKPVRSVGVASLLSGDGLLLAMQPGEFSSFAPENRVDPVAERQDPVADKQDEEPCAASDPYLEVPQPDMSETVAASGNGAAICSASNAGSDTAAAVDKVATDFLSDVAKSKKQHIFLTSPPGIGKTTMVQKLLQTLKEDEGADAFDIDGFYTEEVRDSAGLRSGFDVVRVKGNRTDRCPLARVGQTQPKVGKYTIDVESFEHWALPTIGYEKPIQLPENPILYSKTKSEEELASILVEDVEIGAGETTIIKVVSTGAEELVVNPSLLAPVPEGWRPKSKVAPSNKPKLWIIDEVGKMELLCTKFESTLLAALDGKAVVLGTLPEQQQKAVRDHHVVSTVKSRQDVKVARITRNNREDLVPKVYAWLRESLGLKPIARGEKVSVAATDKKKSATEAPAQGSPTSSNLPAGSPPPSTPGSKLPAGSPPPSTPGGSSMPAGSPPPTPMASPSPVGSPGPDEDGANGGKESKDKKDKKADKKEKKAQKREAERLEGLRRAEERKKRREAANSQKTPLSMEIEEDDDVPAAVAETVNLDSAHPAKKRAVASAAPVASAVASAVPAKLAQKAPAPVVEL